MHKKEFVDYKQFLKFAYDNLKTLSKIKYYGGRLFSFTTGNFRCKYICGSEALTPNKFVSLLGFKNYSAFVSKRFSSLKKYGSDEWQKWYNGFFGGLVGINNEIVNDFLGSGEINTFWDYDKNKAYLHALTGFLPSQFKEFLTPERYLKLNEVDKIPYIYFFEIDIDFWQGEFLKAIGKIRGCYQCFDFLNSKQGHNIIVSEKRLSLINQIYFRNCYKIKKVIVFEKNKFKFYENILTEYEKQKGFYGEDFKKNALRLYGTLGQIYKSTLKNIHFDEKGDLQAEYKQSINLRASPHVSMWVADVVAEEIFNIISSNMKSVISWNVDGLTSTIPLNLKCTKKAGDWKVKKIVGVPILSQENARRLVFKDVENGKIIGGDAMIEKDGELYETVEVCFSNLHKGFVKRKRKIKVKKNIIFNSQNTFRNLIWREKMRNEVLREKSWESW